MTPIESTHATVDKAEGRAGPVMLDAVPAVSAGDLCAAVSKAFQIVVSALAEWHRRARERHQLMELDDRLLKDIGITRSDAYREWRKPFWRP